MTVKNGNGSGPHDDGWILDLNGVKAKEIKAFQTAFEGTQQGDFDAFWPWAVRIVKRWPFAADPTQVESYEELGLVDFREVMFRLSKCFRGFITETESITEGIQTSSEGNPAGTPESS